MPESLSHFTRDIDTSIDMTTDGLAETPTVVLRDRWATAMRFRLRAENLAPEFIKMGAPGSGYEQYSMADYSSRDAAIKRLDTLAEKIEVELSKR